LDERARLDAIKREEELSVARNAKDAAWAAARDAKAAKVRAAIALVIAAVALLIAASPISPVFDLFGKAALH
jgi:hypothetical protein